jgi:hypothetical protein
VIFTKLFVEDGEITGHELTETARDMVQAHERTRTYYRRSDALSEAGGAIEGATYDSSPFLPEGAAMDLRTGTDLLVTSLVGGGSSKTVLVGDTGIEPVTSPV